MLQHGRDFLPLLEGSCHRLPSRQLLQVEVPIRLRSRVTFHTKLFEERLRGIAKISLGREQRSIAQSQRTTQQHHAGATPASRGQAHAGALTTTIKMARGGHRQFPPSGGGGQTSGGRTRGYHAPPDDARIHGLVSGLHSSRLGGTLSSASPKNHTFYQHFLLQGKAKTTAVIAWMRKLLVILNSMVKAEATCNYSPAKP